MRQLYRINKKEYLRFKVAGFILICILLCSNLNLDAQVTFVEEVDITDSALFFDGNKVAAGTPDAGTGYDYVFGNAISPHGDCIKSYKHYVFMTWYRGGKYDRHMMLSRYNMHSGVLKTIEFPHQHTGHNGLWWLGETHNTIAIGISPKNGSIHMVFDMHAYGNSGSFVNDYFRYSFSENNAAEVADEDFTLDLFVKDPIDNDYRHCTMNGVRDAAHFSKYTYPGFFLNDQGDLFLTMRKGTSHNGAQAFIKYDDNNSTWESFKLINALDAKDKGETHNWSIYGNVKYTGGKIRLGFQRRLNNSNDKYKYQNGVYYAYSDDPTGATQWKNYKGEDMTFPLVKAEEVLVYEPGDWVETTQKDQVYIVGGFDWTVTDRGDVHIVSTVKDTEFNVTKSIHSYMPEGASEFAHTTDFGGSGALYTSGDDVYLIGLREGRVYVDMVEGGTNNFQTLYQHSTGKTFSKGVVYIKDGKVYYYLKGNDTDDTHPTYLQIFDLGIVPPDTTRELGFMNLLNGQEIESGSNLTIEASVGSAFKEVSLWHDTTNLGTLTSPPYQWSSHPVLTNMTESSYTFTLIAIDSADVSKEKSITIYTPFIDVLSDKTSLHISFENEAIEVWETDGNDYGVVPAIIDGTNTRDGLKVMALNYSDKTSGHHVQNTADKIVVPDQHYFHLIAYTATSDINRGLTYPTAKLGDWAPTPTFTGHDVAFEFQRKITSRQNTTGDSVNCYPRLRSKASGGACSIYYDDIVLYADSNATADLTAPGKAENLVLVRSSENTVDLSWGEGTDSITGITQTLILRTTVPSEESPVLHPQVAYASTREDGNLTNAGEWEVIASLSYGTNTYTDNTASSNDTCKYAVVHKDVAYNYSDPLVGGVENTSVREDLVLSYKCFGILGGIKIMGIKNGDSIRIYNILGSKVFEKQAGSSNLSISLKQGIYIVNVSGEATKVVVR